MSKSGVNRYKREMNTPTIIAFLEDLCLEWNYVHGFEWHIRVEDIMDIFPTNRKYHLLKNDERGTFNDYEGLGQIFTNYVEKEGL